MSCCDINSDDRKLEIMLNQLRYEVDKMSNTVELKLLTQDCKIAQSISYIKNNLSDELREMLGDMKHSGELQSLITETVLSRVSFLEDVVYPLGHIKRYYPIADGVADDTAQLEKAVFDAKKNNVPLIIDTGTYKITNDVDCRDIPIIDCTGDIICENESQVIIGMDSSKTTGATIQFERIDNLKCIGFKNSTISFRYCKNLNLYANGDNPKEYGLGYTVFNGGFCDKITFFSEGNEIGWINENTFNIRRVNSISIDGNYAHNNNHFEHCNLESGTLNLLNARNNTFSARGEKGITINSTEKSSVNMIEQEYYYRDYFGKDVVEKENGTLIYFPMNKLQTEEILLKIDKNNRSFPVGTIEFTSNGSFVGNSYGKIFHSDLIEINSTFAIKAIADKAVLRVGVNFYDENKNKIITNTVDNFTDSAMKYQDSGEWAYYVTVNKSSDTIVFYPGVAKYVEYCLLFGNNTASTQINYLSLKVVKLVNTNVFITNKIKFNETNTPPKSGYWLQGTTLKINQPKSGYYAGIVCVESGSPGTWRNYGLIQ